MLKDNLKTLSWDFYSKLFIAGFSLFQIFRWQVAPQFMDIYYHLLTAAGFIQAGGYCGWDFWQYAPFGRVHIYPPFFHIILSLLIKCGINQIIIAKFFEVTMPVVFLLVLSNFIRKNFNGCLAFFTLVAAGSSFSFYSSLMSHIPASLAIIFGILAFGQLFQNRILRAVLLLAFCFYSHIGVSWFFAFSFFFYSIFNKQERKKCFTILISALVLSGPILFKQLVNLNRINSLGLYLNEINTSQIKAADYLFAFFGLVLTIKMKRKYLFFASLFLASLIFAAYPYRLFSAEGYLPVIFLSGLFLYNLHTRFKKKFLTLTIIFFILFISPTIKLEKQAGEDKINYKLSLFDSAFLGMQFARGQSIWFPKAYFPIADLIKANSKENDIIYASLDLVGMTFATLSGRFTANALLPEIKPFRSFEPLKSSKIIIFNTDDDPAQVKRAVDLYKLDKIGGNEAFIIYKNISSEAKAQIMQASFPFWLILIVGFGVFLFWKKD